MRPGPGPAAKRMFRPGPQHSCLFEAQARPEPAGPGPGHWPDHIPQHTNSIMFNVLLTREVFKREAFTILLLCNVTAYSCYVHNHTRFQCLCEVWYGQVPIILIMPNIASPEIEMSYIERYGNRFLICIEITYKLPLPLKAEYYLFINTKFSLYASVLKPLFEASLLILLDAKNEHPRSRKF